MTDARSIALMPSTRHRHIQSSTRFAVLVAVAVLALPHTQRWNLAFVIPALSPFVALASALSTRVFALLSLLGAAIGLVVLLRRRSFCRWLCPTGLLADTATGLGRRAGRRCPRVPPMGQWIVFVTLGGALMGYPMLLWLDPLALLACSFSPLAIADRLSLLLSVGGLVTVILLSTVWPGIWCQRICPLGATQDLLTQLSATTRRTAGSRSQDSLLGATAGSAGDTPFRFVGRLFRGTTTGSETASAASDRGMSRRMALGTIAGIGWGGAARNVLSEKHPCIRPPGALEEIAFTGLCVRCGNCTRCCPTSIIKPDGWDRGLAGLLAPVISFDEDYCREDCTRCGDVCPSGALRPTSVTEKISTPIGMARIDMDICLLAEDRECSECRNSCPFEAIAYVWSETDYMLTPQINIAKCPGCGACEVACPTEPEKAIRVFPIP